jgi:hypothetical protein
LCVAASEIPSKPLPLVREQVTTLCINALFSYRKFCATVSSSGQLILPEALKLLPLYTLGMWFLMHFLTNNAVEIKVLFLIVYLPVTFFLAFNFKQIPFHQFICLFLLHHFCIYILVTCDRNPPELFSCIYWLYWVFFFKCSLTLH